MAIQFQPGEHRMTTPLKKIVLLPLVLLLTVPVITAQRKNSSQAAMDETVRTLFAATGFAGVSMSPDGKQVAWVENSAVYVAEAHAGAKPRRITAGDGKALHDDSAPAWSPDSKRLAFLSDAAKAGQQQLYVIDATGGVAKRLTNVKGFLAAPGWSPDGKTIALLFTENAERAAGPLVAEVAQTGVIKESVTEQRLALVDVAAGNLRQISPADMYVYEYDWSPDGKRFVTTAAYGNGDNNWYIAQIYTIDADGGEMKSIHATPLQVANPAWSPDGKSVAFIEGLMSDEPSVGGDIFVVPADGAEARNVTPGMKASASWLTWTPDGRKIFFGEEIDGGSGLATVDVNSGKIDTLFQTGEQISANSWGTAVSVSFDHKMTAMVRQSLAHPPEVWAGPIGNWQQITSTNANLKPTWGEAKSIHWTNEGFHLQGWLLYPRSFDPSRKYPMVVQVHGGPGAMARSSWPGSHSFGVALSSAGYFVFMPNPRGSFGEGEDFTRANVKDFGYGDWRDIMTGVDQALKEAPIDEHKLGLTGWSYGGYMTMWGVTQTHRFAAAVAGAGIANYQSYYGENQIDQWMIPFFGASVYDDPQVYAKSSPITFIKNAKTPTLVLVGDSDGECPTPQSYEFWHALKTIGTETEFVVYEHEGHVFARPEHQRNVIERVREWFDKHLNSR
ncbi:MAG TPA: S9 family peptidase [Candidatus Angelobacter sp.]|jgi:dipeptidyl aminopeptidase/acylaminoacyl peptidase|nr:S9 family peptidase [Candidatus Angelobacter sp.]